MNDTEKKAYALGIIATELGIDFDSVSPEALAEVNTIAEDALADEPKSEIGKKIKAVIAEEEAKGAEGDYNKSFNFHKDLNEGKIDPAIAFLFQLFAKYADRIVAKDEKVEGEMLSEYIIKLNELNYPTGYIANAFNGVMAPISKMNKSLAGQLEHREDEIKALSIGVKHPVYGTLSPHLATFNDLDTSIKTLQTTFNLTEEDYRGKAPEEPKKAEEKTA